MSEEIIIEQKPVIAFDKAGACKLVVYADGKGFELKALYPVKFVSGEEAPDPTRAPRFFSQIQANVRGMAVPFAFELTEPSIEDAINAFGAYVEKAQRDCMEQVEANIRRASIMMPPGATPPTRQ